MGCPAISIASRSDSSQLINLRAEQVPVLITGFWWKNLNVPNLVFNSTMSAASLTVMPLGAGNEVGRSAILLSFRGKNVLLDCGIHPAHSGIASLPFFDAIDPTSIDLILITQ